MCEVGAWKNYEILEEELTLDELFELYEGTTERQIRMMKTMAAAMGASVDDDEVPEGQFDWDNPTYEYAEQEVAAEGQILFGYRTKEATPGE